MEIVGGAEALRAAGAGGEDVDIAALLAYAAAAATVESDSEPVVPRPLHTTTAASRSGTLTAAPPAPDMSQAQAVFGKRISADDLKLIEGIGPKIADIFRDAGIRSWRALADTPVERLRTILGAAGDRYRLADPTSWPAQAALAADGRFEELKKLQDELVAGRGADRPEE
jgi:predicted flap endonuclease-1-like 5' DNA nuclease